MVSLRRSNQATRVEFPCPNPTGPTAAIPHHFLGWPRAARWCCGLLALAMAACASPPKAQPAARAASLAESFVEKAGVVRVRSGRAELFVSGPEIRSKMLQLIGGARHSLLINSYLVTKSEFTTQIIAALKLKQAQGVRVQVTADSSSRFVAAPAAFDELTKAGIPWAEFHPIRLATVGNLPRLLERDHRKVWIIDGRTVFLGGANLTSESLGDPGANGNLDLMVAFDSPEAARRLTASYVATWNEASQQKLRAEDFVIPETRSADTGAWVFDQQLDGEPANIGTMFAGLFGAARRELWLVHSYTFTNPTLLRLVRDATARGVRVHLVLAHRAVSRRLLCASHYGIRDFQQAGGEVWIHDRPGTYLHSKGVLADDRWTCVGSANLNRRSCGLSREVGVVFDDPGLARQFRMHLDTVRAESHRVSPAEARRYRTPRHWFWWKVLQWAG